MPPRPGPSRAMGTTGAMSHLGVCRSRFAPASPGCCARQLQTPRGGLSHGVGTAADQHLPIPLWHPPASPGGCCANRGAHPMAPHRAAPLRPGRGDLRGKGVRGGGDGGGGSFVRWELTGSLPPISHGLFLLPPAWALRRSWRDKGPVGARGPQHPTGMMPAGPPRPRGATLKEGLAAALCRTPQGEQDRSPPPAPCQPPGDTQAPPSRVGERKVRGCARQHKSPPRVPPSTRVWGCFGVAGGRALGQRQSVVQPLPEHPARALLSHTTPPQWHAWPPREEGRVLAPLCARTH